MDATVDAALTPKDEAPPRGRYLKSPIAKRRWRTFRANRRAYWSMWLFLLLCLVSGLADIVAINGDEELRLAAGMARLQPQMQHRAFGQLRFDGFRC